MNKAPILATKAEAAEQLAISVRYLEHLIKRQDLPIVRLGAAVRIPMKAVVALAAKGVARRSIASRSLTPTVP